MGWSASVGVPTIIQASCLAHSIGKFPLEKMHGHLVSWV